MTNLSEADRAQFYTELAAATSPKTAEVLMHEVLDVHREDLVTKSDLAILEGKFAGLQGEFAGLQGQFAGLQGEFAGLRGEFSVLKSDVAELRSEVRIGFARVDARFAQQEATIAQQFHVNFTRTFTLMIALFSLLGGLVIATH